MRKHYILDANKEPVPCDMMTWAMWFGDTDRRRVASTRVGKTWVSTVFLGLDHRFGPGEPLLFETMLFDRRHFEDYQERYSTYAEALAGHRRAVYLVYERQRAALPATSRNAREGSYAIRRSRASLRALA